jgi:hypothetical protein
MLSAHCPRERFLMPADRIDEPVFPSENSGNAAITGHKEHPENVEKRVGNTKS